MSARNCRLGSAKGTQHKSSSQPLVGCEETLEAGSGSDTVAEMPAAANGRSE
ncbi:hypothetical protein [Anaplasma centrale]|uniref:hypothetical protein n=1 Tax=Anaplasma centrale TaxID=769 RepID=UPI00031B5DB7|nr:hypothetical protein [Anaplasma centrale]